MNKKHVDVVVVGGGLIGMLSARELVLAGAEVRILEKSGIAKESSWAGGGILSPLYPWRYADAVNQLAKISQQQYPLLSEALIDETGLDPEFNRCGMLVNSADVDNQAESWLQSNQIQCEAFVPDTRCTDFAITGEYSLLPKIAQIRNPRLLKAMRASLIKKGVQFDTNTLEAYQPLLSGAVELHTANGRLVTGNLVIAAGAWSRTINSIDGASAGIVDAKSDRVAVKPIRGQMLLFKAPQAKLKHIILSAGKYIIPRLDGRVLVGSTMEDVGFDKRTTLQAKEMLKAFVADVCPDLLKYPIEHHWSGLRPGSPDGVPFICQHPNADNIYFNCGHFRNGVVMAPASAKLLADLLLDRATDISSAAYIMG